MVKVVICERDEFVKHTLNKKVYCFGAGKAFRKFCAEFNEVPISGIIDNYRYLDEEPVNINDKKYYIMSIDQAVEKLAQDSILVITSQAFEDIVYQLDGIQELDGLECFIKMSLNNYQGVKESERKAWNRLITDLSTRNTNIGNKSSSFGDEYGNTHRFQLWDYYLAETIKGNKARVDIRNIASELGFRAVRIHNSVGKDDDVVGRCSKLQVEREWKEFYNMLPQNAFVLLQHPFPMEQPERNRMLMKMKEEKGARFISVVHDVEQLRVVYDSAYRLAEYKLMLQIADVLIVHNERMKSFFIEKGVPKHRLITLKIFDYIYTEEMNKAKFDRSITIAGNLSLWKSPYVAKLGELAPMRIHLYGPYYSKDLLDNVPQNIVYHGAFPPEEVPKLMEKGFGLVWDGEDLDTCSGATGNYLRYNNPHKLSMYLASGLPVVVWAESAEAEFVKENGLGLVIHSLFELSNELDHIDEIKYEQYLQAVRVVSKAIRSGQFIRQAIAEAEMILEKAENSASLVLV